jgi:hypothetical protein
VMCLRQAVQDEASRPVQYVRSRDGRGEGRGATSSEVPEAGRAVRGIGIVRGR